MAPAVAGAVGAASAAVEESFQHLALAARTLDELIEDGLSGTRTDISPAASERARELMARWRRLAAGGDPEAFGRRLAWDGWSHDELLDTLARAMTLTADDLPARTRAGWLEVIRQILASTHFDRPGRPAAARLPGPSGVGTGSSIPFREIWAIFVKAGASRLASISPGWTHLLTPSARTDLETHLCSQLDTVGGALLRALLRAPVEGSRVTEQESSLHTRYGRCLEHLFRGGLGEFFTQFPAWARLTARVVESWCATVSEFCTRLDSDTLAVTRRFGGGAQLGKVSRIQPALSDRHDGGRQVWALTFETGVRLIYKPRDVGLEAAWNLLLAELEDLGLEPAPPPIAVLPGEGYGWIEFVPQAGAADGAAARAYFRSAGSLLCLAYVFRAADLHMENLVAGPRGPVLVDCETLLQPRRARPRTPNPGESRHEPCTISGMVSVLQSRPESGCTDVGGLAGRGGYPVAAPERLLTVDAGGILVEDERPSLSPEGSNALILAGSFCHPARFRDELVDGFRSAWRFLDAHHRTLLAPGGVLESFLPASTRMVIRPSHLYGWLLQRSLVPAYLSDGPSRSVFLDVINRVPQDRGEASPLWPLVREERRALENLDLPRFQVAVTAERMTDGLGGPVGEGFAASGYVAVRERLGELREGALARQVAAIDLCLATAALAQEPDRIGPSQTPIAQVLTHAGHDALDRLELTAIIPHAGALVDLAARLAAQVAALTDQELSEPPVDQDGDPLSPHYLYSGLAGRSLFLAALAVVTGEPEYRLMARSWCAALTGERPGGQTVVAGVHTPIGACHGAGGIIYVTTLLGWLLGDERFVELAKSAAAVVTADRIAADRRLDVEGGAAGAILGLLALHAFTGEDEHLDRAVRCGRHLLSEQEPAPSGGAAWPSPEGLMLTGFAHGAAGVMTALGRLAAATGERTFLAGAHQALEFVHGQGSGPGTGWPAETLDPDGRPVRVPMRAWCHGAPGIALGLATSGVITGASSDHALDEALRLTAAGPVHEVDHICCGEFGVADILLHLGEVFGRHDLATAGAGRSAIAVQRAECLTSDGFRIEKFNPARAGFFRGLSGIGYGLLRLVRPGLFPSVAALQPPGTLPGCNRHSTSTTPDRSGKEAP